MRSHLDRRAGISGGAAVQRSGAPGKRTRTGTVQRRGKGAAPAADVQPAAAPAADAEVSETEADGADHDVADDVQRKVAAPVVQRQGEGEGEGEGAKPDPNRKVAKLHLFADIDVKSLGLKDLTSGRVGHTWIAIEYLDPAAVPDSVAANHKALLEAGGKYSDPMGFWPDTQNGVYYNPNPFKSWVQGWMRHPDRAHEGSEKATQSWEITQAEVDAVIRYAESKRGAQYSVYFFNCTTFGAEAVQAAGKSAPSASTAGICFPNALYDGILANQKKGVGNTWTQDLETGEETEVQGREETRKG